jgi:hypothetical protein
MKISEEAKQVIQAKGGAAKFEPGSPPSVASADIYK